jgi:MraZ protein
VAEVQGLPVFTGKYEHQLDDASRVVMPARLRDKLGGTLFLELEKKPYPHLVLSPEDAFKREWEHWLQGIKRDDPKWAELRNRFNDGHLLTLDGQGRLALPTELRQAANLKQTVLVVGSFIVVEIWDCDYYRIYRQQDSAEQ